MVWMRAILVLCAASAIGCRTEVQKAPPQRFVAGDESMKFTVDITDSERRGAAPSARPAEVKKECWTLLEQLRHDAQGLREETERNVETFFTVADAFEADGLLQQSVDYLSDLKHKLEDLIAARAGRPSPSSLIRSEEDILAFRDAHNVHAMDEKYMTGAQPTEKGYRWLRSKGVTAVINLREPSEHERRLVESLGMKYVHIPWADERPPTREQVEQMLAAVKASPGPVYQHCLRGIGRDMTMASCYMVANHGMPAAVVIERGRKEAPRWEADQKRDAQTGEPVQFELVREFERQWQRDRSNP